ncbi:aspartyl/asparaginyl beta-hydroxylase domain-containing protein [Azospirillum sp. sgz302134]
MERFQSVTIGSGLTLHAAASARLDADRLKAEFAALDAVLPPEGRTHYGAAPGSGWTAIPLLTGKPEPGLEHMPTVRSFLERPDLRVQCSHVLRQPPHGKLDWHYECMGLHCDMTRLLIPIHAPEGAFTLIGHEVVTYPEGQCWTGDFSFPHQVDNPTDRDRVILAVDVLTTDEIRALFPAALAADPVRRAALASEAQSLFLEWRNNAPAVMAA